MIHAQLFLQIQFTLHRKWSAAITVTSTSIRPLQRTVCVKTDHSKRSETDTDHHVRCVTFAQF